ncbi:MAG: PilZ domain-containing protein [Novosphingobium sp.]|nr:PilZ domain-containing protein [Novosphingobium sp.]
MRLPLLRAGPARAAARRCPQRVAQARGGLRLALPLVLYAGGRPLAATFVDISQHGAGIECRDHLALNERVRLVCDCLPELTARVRWRQRPLYGVIFEQLFRYDELARLTAPHQTAAVVSAIEGRRG